MLNYTPYGTSDVITDRSQESAKVSSGHLAELLLDVKKQRCSRDAKTLRRSTEPALDGKSANDQDGLFIANQGHRAPSKRKASLANDEVHFN